jgi:hypothetical protein
MLGSIGLTVSLKHLNRRTWLLLSPLSLLGLARNAAGSQTGLRSWTSFRYPPLGTSRQPSITETLTGKTFTGANVLLDGRRFVRCTFDMCTLIWNGSDVDVVDCKVSVDTEFGSERADIGSAFVMMGSAYGRQRTGDG